MSPQPRPQYSTSAALYVCIVLLLPFSGGSDAKSYVADTIAPASVQARSQGVRSQESIFNARNKGKVGIRFHRVYGIYLDSFYLDFPFLSVVHKAFSHRRILPAPRFCKKKVRKTLLSPGTCFRIRVGTTAQRQQPICNHDRQTRLSEAQAL